ncbi:MAG: hypothetical protein ABL929_12430, partial [Ferruginibacter sp.]
CSIILTNSCKHEEPIAIIDTTPIAGSVVNNGVCFESEILPIFQSNCAKSGCHNIGTHASDLVLDNFSNITRKYITPYNANLSKMYKVLFETGSDKMPQIPNPDLTSSQKTLIGKWINEGAKNTVNCNSNCDSSQFKFAANITPLLNTYCVGCHGGTSPSANINLSIYNGVKQQAVNGRLVGAITHAPGFSPMPQAISKLSDCQIAQVKKWVAAGALNN